MCEVYYHKDKQDGKDIFVWYFLLVQMEVVYIKPYAKIV